MARIAGQSLAVSLIRVCRVKSLRKEAGKLCVTIMRRFFFPQHRARLFPGRIPVTSVDHPLDGTIPFEPGRVGIYLDFVPSWIRMAGFLLRRFGSSAVEPVRDFIITMEKLYRFASETYLLNFSTTKRPAYYGRLRFLVIHITDPHLMCIPSLHVMIVIRTWTTFRLILAALGPEAEEECRDEAAEIFRRALEITEAVLYIKQHSLNCISAALYAIECFDPALFGDAEAECFVSRLFTAPDSPPGSAALRDFMLARYRAFAAARPRAAGSAWNAPLLDFLRDPGS